VINKSIRVNTYAELYGNIKKRRIKSLPDNKLISETPVIKGLEVNELFGTNKFAEVGDALSFINEKVSPITQLGDDFTSKFGNQLSAFGDIARGKKLPSL